MSSEQDNEKPRGVWPGMFDDLVRRGPDPRSPEEIAEAQAKENARRKGRGRRDWWKAHLDDEGKPKT